MQRCAHTLLRSLSHVEAQTAEGHAVRCHIQLPGAARMMPHYVAILAVAEKIEPLLRKAVPIRHSRHLLGHDKRSWFAEGFCNVEIGELGCQER